MPRVARIGFPSMIYHVICWGNDRQQIFNDKEDFEKYLEICGREWERSKEVRRPKRRRPRK